MARKRIGVAGGASPHIGVCRRENDVFRIRPVLVQALPDSARAFRDVSLRAVPLMHLKVLIRAVAKEPRAARPEVGESGDILLGREGSYLVKMDGRHLLILSGEHCSSESHDSSPSKLLLLFIPHGRSFCVSFCLQ